MPRVFRAPLPPFPSWLRLHSRTYSGRWCCCSRCASRQLHRPLLDIVPSPGSTFQAANRPSSSPQAADRLSSHLQLHVTLHTHHPSNADNLLADEFQRALDNRLARSSGLRPWVLISLLAALVTPPPPPSPFKPACNHHQLPPFSPSFHGPPPMTPPPPACNIINLLPSPPLLSMPPRR